MLRSLFTAATGMEAQTIRISVIANNLANVNTTGFKSSRAEFQDLLYQSLRSAGSPSSSSTEVPTGLEIGLGTRPVSTHKIFTQGDFMLTGNELDIAIEGEGFFQILQPNGDTGYTRAGAFSQDSDGAIVTPDGYKLQPEITIPSDALSISIGADGTVSVIQPGSSTPSTVGNIELSDFANEAGLKAMGKNLFIETAASGSPTTGTPGEDGLGTLAQGFLEMSNVNIVQEMVDMITAQRAYEINSEAIKTSDKMLQIAANLVR